MSELLKGPSSLGINERRNVPDWFFELDGAKLTLETDDLEGESE